MIRTFSKARVFLFLSGLVFLGALGGEAFAQDQDSDKVTWEYHKSITGAFDVRFPSKYKIKSIPLRMDGTSVVFRSEIVASTGSGDHQKVFVVKVDQTLSSRLKAKVVKKLLDIDLYKYKKSAQNAGGVLVANEELKIDGFLGRELYITYGDGNKKQGIRVKIMYTDISRVEMVLTGPASSMYAFKSNNFFESLKLYDGPGRIDGEPGENWVDYESPLGIFTLKLPGKDNTFMKGPPRFTHDGIKEKGRVIFVDPLLGYKSVFNFFGYKVNEKLNFDKVKALLMSGHIAPYATNIRLEDLNIDTSTAEDGSHGIITTVVRMRALDKYPYINTIFYKVLFNDNGVVVLEYMAAHDYMSTPLPKTVMSLVQFHPEKFSTDRAAGAGQSGEDSSLEDEDSEEDEDPEATTLRASIKLGSGGDDEEESGEAGENEEIGTPEQDTGAAVSDDGEQGGSSGENKKKPDEAAQVPEQVVPDEIKMDPLPSENSGETRVKMPSEEPQTPAEE